jgi:hypothetical protein
MLFSCIINTIATFLARYGPILIINLIRKSRELALHAYLSKNNAKITCLLKNIAILGNKQKCR